MIKKFNIDRIIDANSNRVKEGLRVVEDITRFVLNDQKLTIQFKKARHAITDALKSDKLSDPAKVISQRQIQKDVGRKTISTELNRNSIADIFLANSQRVKESIRVLEECVKLFNKKSSAKLKILRYTVYDLEKRSIEKINKLCHNK